MLELPPSPLVGNTLSGMARELREVRDEDLPLLFEQWADPSRGTHGRVYGARAHGSARIRASLAEARAEETVLDRVVVVDGDVAGTIGSWVTHTSARSRTGSAAPTGGKGIATDALDAFLRVDRTRPLHAHVASDNVASRRVLEKCGFRVIATERHFAEARSAARVRRSRWDRRTLVRYAVSRRCRFRPRCSCGRRR